MHSTQVFFMKFNPVILLCIYWNFKNTQIKNKHQESMNRKVRITSAKYFFMGENFHTFTASTDAITYKNSLHLLFYFSTSFLMPWWQQHTTVKKKKQKNLFKCLFKHEKLSTPFSSSFLYTHCSFLFQFLQLLYGKIPEARKQKKTS